MALHIQDLQDEVHLAASVVLPEILGLRDGVACFGVEESLDERGLASLCVTYNDDFVNFH